MGSHGRKFIKLVVLSAAASAISGAGAAAPPALPTLSPEVAAHVPKDLRTYFVGFFVNPAEPKDMTQDLFVRHQAYMRRQVEKGVYHLMGPLTDIGRIRGVVVLTADSLDDARTILEADPIVVEHVAAIEVHGAMFPNLETLKIEYAPQISR